MNYHQLQGFRNSGDAKITNLRLYKIVTWVNGLRQSFNVCCCDFGVPQRFQQFKFKLSDIVLYDIALYQSLINIEIY